MEMLILIFLLTVIFSYMMALTEEHAPTEHKIYFTRQAHNDSVMDYNTNREILPISFIANAFSFAIVTSFEITNSLEKEPVKVSFK